MSQAVINDNVVYLAGQVASDAKASVTEQTRQVLAAIDRLLEEAGTDKTKLLTATIWMKDIAAFDEMNSVWDKWVSPGSAPARATVQGALARAELLVEIMGTARIG
jgi:enamine deaminase RidA (YjgF/YER057c/UK114 family)